MEVLEIIATFYVFSFFVSCTLNSKMKYLKNWKS